MPFQSVKFKEDINDNQDSNQVSFIMEHDLLQIGLTGLSAIHANLSPARLYEEALQRKEVENSILNAQPSVLAGGDRVGWPRAFELMCHGVVSAGIEFGRSINTTKYQGRLRP